jgi:hypothetical protein
VTVADDVSIVSGIRLFTHLTATSGAPFNIITGQDLNGDTQYNDRPAFATDLSRPSVVRTRWGAFDSNPVAGQTIIPRNYAEGPGLISMDLGAMRSIRFGPLKTADTSGTPVERRYTLEIRGQVINLLNHQNLATPVAVVNSPLFGRSVGLVGGSSLSPDRSIDLQVCLKF